MWVKVGSTWYNSDEQTLSVQFKDNELDFIKSNMNKETSPNNRFTVGVGSYEDLIKFAREKGNEDMD